jgi:hypothetical protein
MDDGRRRNTTIGLAHCDREALLAGRLLRTSILVLMVAASAWMCGSAWWNAQSVGPTRWLGGIVDVFGFLGSLGAIGMIWYALRWKHATRTLQHYLQDVAVFTDPGADQLDSPSGDSYGWIGSEPHDP